MSRQCLKKRKMGWFGSTARGKTRLILKTLGLSPTTPDQACRSISSLTKTKQDIAHQQSLHTSRILNVIRYNSYQLFLNSQNKYLYRWCVDIGHLQGLGKKYWARLHGAKGHDALWAHDWLISSSTRKKFYLGIKQLIGSGRCTPVDRPAQVAGWARPVRGSCSPASLLSSQGVPVRAIVSCLQLVAGSTSLNRSIYFETKTSPQCPEEIVFLSSVRSRCCRCNEVKFCQKSARMSVDPLLSLSSCLIAWYITCASVSIELGATTEWRSGFRFSGLKSAAATYSSISFESG